MKIEPLRTCIITREKLPQRQLLRIIVDEGVVRLDNAKHRTGRGFYIKKDLEVLNIGIEKGKIAGILKLGRKLSESEIEELRRGIINGSSNEELIINN